MQILTQEALASELGEITADVLDATNSLGRKVGHPISNNATEKFKLRLLNSAYYHSGNFPMAPFCGMSSK